MFWCLHILGDNTKAYIYYDVLDQYNETMRTSANINWSIGGAASNQVNTSTGKITIQKSTDGEDIFTYGSKISVTGVEAVSGKSVSEVVEIGMAQAIDEVEMIGFVNEKGDKTKFVTSLPSDFAKDTWYLLYKTKDQGGNELDAEVYDSQKITFIVEQPLLVDSTFSAGKLYTIDGIEYASVKVNPGQYAERGGDVTFNAISNKTGKKTPKNFTIGEGKLLSNLELMAPSGTIAAGVGGKNYGVSIERGSDAKDIIQYYNKDAEQSKVVLTNSKAYSIDDSGTETEISGENSIAGYWPGTVSATERTQFTTKYSIVSKTAGSADSKWATASKIVSSTYTVVPLSYMKSFDITDTADRYQLVTVNSGRANGSSIDDLATPVTGATIQANGELLENDELKLTGLTGFKVKGTTRDNVVVEIPNGYFKYVDEEMATANDYTQSDIITKDNKITAVSEGAIRWNELYDENTAKSTRMEVSKTLRLLVSDKGSVNQVIAKTLKISDAWSGVASFTFGTNNKATNTEMSGITKEVVVKDQYGQNITNDVSVIYDITNTDENDLNSSTNNTLGAFAHMSNSLAVSGQSTANIRLSGVEIGDKFKITGTVVGTNVTNSVDVTVGSDTLAYITNKSTSDDDKLRETLGVRQ